MNTIDHTTKDSQQYQCLTCDEQVSTRQKLFEHQANENHRSSGFKIVSDSQNG